MDGNNGIDPEPHSKLAGLANAHEHDDHYPHGDVDHNLGTLPFRDLNLDPITPAYRGRLLLSDPYPLFLDPDPDALAKFKFDWDKLARLEPRPDITLERYASRFDRVSDWNRLGTDEYGNWDFSPAESIGVFHYNTHPNGDIILKFDPNSITYAIIRRHLDAAYAEIASTLLGATRDDSEGDPDAETEANPARNCC